MNTADIRQMYIATAFQALINKYGILPGVDEPLPERHLKALSKASITYADALLSAQTGGHITHQING